MEGPASKNPYALITESYVKKALMEDKGNGVHLISWTVEDFTKNGDNMATFVTSVKVSYSLNGHDESVSYVVKLNPCRDSLALEVFMDQVFVKESDFFSNIAPALSRELTSVGMETLRFPRCFHSFTEKGLEVIFTEDLRSRGFRMSDRKMGLDRTHVILALQELARLHAASRLMQNRCPTGDLSDEYPSLKLEWVNNDDENALGKMLTTHMSTSINLLKNIGGYDKAVDWINKLKPRVMKVLVEQITRNSTFDALCHGDFWNNNMLFRYDDSGVPVEVMLIDLQVNRMASLATDLNYFLYTSTLGDVRKNNMEDFLTTYYDTFKTVIEKGDASMPFTLQELKQEFREKHIYGLVFAIIMVQFIVIDDKDIIKQEDFFKEGAGMDAWKEKSKSLMESNPLMKPRFLSLIDEMMDAGVIV